MRRGPLTPAEHSAWISDVRAFHMTSLTYSQTKLPT